MLKSCIDAYSPTYTKYNITIVSTRADVHLSALHAEVLAGVNRAVFLQVHPHVCCLMYTLRTHTRTKKRTDTYTHKNTHTHIHTHTRTDSHTQAFIQTLSQTLTRIHTQTQAQTHTHTYTHSLTCTQS